jgi:hypothetical protein
MARRGMTLRRPIWTAEICVKSIASFNRLIDTPSLRAAAGIDTNKAVSLCLVSIHAE